MSRVPRIMAIMIFVIAANIITFWLFSPSREAIRPRLGPQATFQPVPLPSNPFGKGVTPKWRCSPFRLWCRSRCGRTSISSSRPH